jgi:hypothetical protein
MNILRALLIPVVLTLAACGGGDDVECRPDIMGPPAPELAGLPVCDAQ